jgi:hypothetical protein
MRNIDITVIVLLIILYPDAEKKPVITWFQWAAGMELR